MSILNALLLQQSRQSDPVPTDPVPMPDPIPRPQPMPTRRQIKNRLNVSTQSRSVTFGAKQRCHALVQRMRLTASLYTSERSLFPTEITKTTTFSSITWYTRR